MTGLGRERLSPWYDVDCVFVCVCVCLCVFSLVGASCVGRQICVCAAWAPLRRVNRYTLKEHHSFFVGGSSICPHSAIGLLVHLLELAAPNANVGDTGAVPTTLHDLLYTSGVRRGFRLLQNHPIPQAHRVTVTRDGAQKTYECGGLSELHEPSHNL